MNVETGNWGHAIPFLESSFCFEFSLLSLCSEGIYSPDSPPPPLPPRSLHFFPPSALEISVDTQSYQVTASRRSTMHRFSVSVRYELTVVLVLADFFIFPCTGWVLSFMLSFNVIIFCYNFPPFFFFLKTKATLGNAGLCRKMQ
jgi:hypothetical protein